MNPPSPASWLDGESSQPGPGKITFTASGTGRIRILHIINDLALGGSEIALCRLLSLTDRSLFDPVVIFLREPSTLRTRIEALGIPVLGAGMKKPIPSLASIWALTKLVRKVSPDLIQGWMYHGSLAVIKLCALLSGRANGIVFVSYSSRWQHESYGYSRKNNWVIPNGFDVCSLASRPLVRSSLRENLGFSEDALIIGHVGRFHPSKDHVTFLRAAAMLALEHSDVQFVLCGSGVDSNNPTLINLCRELNLIGRAHLLGERADAESLIAGFDVLTSSSQSEACPNVIGEAMACGVPCVVTDIGDMPRMVGSTGHIVPPGDPMAMAQSWKHLIELGAEGRLALGFAARERAINHFSLDSVVHQYESLYRVLAGLSGAEISAWEELDPAYAGLPSTEK